MSVSKGTCLCGSVTITMTNNNKQMGTCHCSMCRKWTGGPYMTVDGGTDVALEGEENITAFQSSEWAERGFCKKCGSNLFYKLKDSGQYFLSAGLFENSADFIFDHQVFIDEKPQNYSFANQTQTMTGAEVFAQYAPETSQ